MSPPLTTHHSLLTTHHQPLTTHHSPLTTNHRRLKILFTEGSSISARQTLYALGPRCLIDVLDPNPRFCLARFSRFVRRCYRCPPFAADPGGYLQFLTERLRAERYNVLFPTHDQAFLLSRARDRLAHLTGVPVPDFAVMQRVQSKAAFMDVLAELGLPHPATRRIHSRGELEQERAFPYYVKLPYSTAGCGVWRVEDPETARVVADRLENMGLFSPGKDVLVQAAAPGVLGVAQSVFQNGRLVAAHTYQARALGVGGSARARVSVHLPQVPEHLSRLGAHLHWHGALMLDFLIEPGTGNVSYIEANPRIGETVNALLSGVNLPELLIEIALGNSVSPRSPSRSGTRTHSLVMGLMALAKEGACRPGLLSETLQALTKVGIYAGSEDELTRPARDLPAVVPALFLATRLLINPDAAERIVTRAVNDYALTEEAIATIIRMG